MVVGRQVLERLRLAPAGERVAEVERDVTAQPDRQDEALDEAALLRKATGFTNH
jgi:hypothetical protein